MPGSVFSLVQSYVVSTRPYVAASDPPPPPQTASSPGSRALLLKWPVAESWAKKRTGGGSDFEGDPRDFDVTYRRPSSDGGGGDATKEEDDELRSLRAKKLVYRRKSDEIQDSSSPVPPVIGMREM